MFPANAYLIRDIRVDDVPELVRLGWDSERTGLRARSSSARSTVSSPLHRARREPGRAHVRERRALPARADARAGRRHAGSPADAVGGRPIRERKGQRLATR